MDSVENGGVGEAFDCVEIVAILKAGGRTEGGMINHCFGQSFYFVPCYFRYPAVMDYYDESDSLTAVGYLAAQAAKRENVNCFINCGSIGM